MSNAFNNFLGGISNGIFGQGPIMKDYQHADRVYVKNNYARTPKLGFLYFVSFNFNLDALPSNVRWSTEGYREVGLLVKKIDLPKFNITTETINQYNRKTVVQTTLKYNPINIDFHDDNSNITRDMWKSYFQYYYADSNYSGANANFKIPPQFGNTKYGITDSPYGLNSNQNNPFISSIDIFVLHQQNFTQYTLVNPLITEWNHDSLEQADGAKLLTNKMSVTYETVFYREGIIKKSNAEAFSAIYYDKSPSPLSVAGNGNNTILGPGGIAAGINEVFNGEGNILQKAIIGSNVIRNAKSVTSGSLKQEGYSILSGVLGSIQQTGNQPGGIGSAIQNGINQRGIGINIFSDQNSSVNGSTTATPSNLTRGGRG